MIVDPLPFYQAVESLTVEECKWQVCEQESVVLADTLLDKGGLVWSPLHWYWWILYNPTGELSNLTTVGQVVQVLVWVLWLDWYICVALIFILRCSNSSLAWIAVLTFLVVSTRFVLICILTIWSSTVSISMDMIRALVESSRWPRLFCLLLSPRLIQMPLSSVSQFFLFLLLGGRDGWCQGGKSQTCWSDRFYIMIGRFEILCWTQPSLVTSLPSWVLILQFYIYWHKCSKSEQVGEL